MVCDDLGHEGGGLLRRAGPRGEQGGIVGRNLESVGVGFTAAWEECS